jgi:glucose-fructose oxidoreductase
MTTEKTWKFVGISFEHMHMGDLLNKVFKHPKAEIAGICDENAHTNPDILELRKRFEIPDDRVFTDLDECLKSTEPDVAMLCPATARHADYVERVAPYDVHVLVEKPFAASLEEADRMIAAMEKTGKEMIINWPLRWYPPHVTTKKLCDDGVIGQVLQVHYYDGNRGPLRHGAGKVEKEPGEKSKHWWYHKSAGGGSLLDYLGYGVTLGTWYHNGKAPIEVTAMVDDPAALEVDEHSVTIARYDTGLSKYETRWGTFTDPWTNQPQPKCGFVIVGEKGTIASYDYEDHVRLQTEDCPEGKDVPVIDLPENAREPVGYFLDCLENGHNPEGPLSPEIARIGQQIVDTAYQSAQEKRTLALLDR